MYPKADRITSLRFGALHADDQQSRSLYHNNNILYTYNYIQMKTTKQCPNKEYSSFNSGVNCDIQKLISITYTTIALIEFEQNK